MGWKLRRRSLFGIEGDAGVTNARGARSCPTGFFYNCEITTNWLATAPARAAQRGICRVAAQACFALGEPSCLHIVVDLAVRGSDLATLAMGTTKLRHRSIEPLLACAQLPTDPPPRIAIRRRASSAPKARSK